MRLFWNILIHAIISILGVVTTGSKWDAIIDPLVELLNAILNTIENEKIKHKLIRDAQSLASHGVHYDYENAQFAKRV